MGRCYSRDLMAVDHIHMDIIICNIEEPHQKYALERSVIDYRSLMRLMSYFDIVKSIIMSQCQSAIKG